MNDEVAPKTFEEKCTAVDMCPKCGGELDTGWECNNCGFDAIALISLPPAGHKEAER